ncbi:hypothetical protein [Salinisphaera sp. S4-8]|uniref:hypothetical protein n=1 Tax=Salinisphaera sp. S4-8 TaxID=633357 RepID=UPI003340E3D3
MRTSLLVLVQISGLFLISGAACAQSNSGYADDSTSDSGTSQTQTRGTVLDMPAGENTVQGAATPRPDTPPRGMTKARVEARYGAPLSKSQPVGQPPITRWDYPEYRLYFEYDHVLHAVVPDHFEPVTHSDELQPAN